MRNHIHSFVGGVIIHTCPDFDGGLIKLSLKLRRLRFIDLIGCNY